MSLLIDYYTFIQADQASHIKYVDSWLLLIQEGFASYAHAIAPHPPFGFQMQAVINFWPPVLNLCGHGAEKKCVTELQRGSCIYSLTSLVYYSFCIMHGQVLRNLQFACRSKLLSEV